MMELLDCFKLIVVLDGLKSKGVVVLVIILMLLFSVTILLDYDNTPLAALMNLTNIWFASMANTR